MKILIINGPNLNLLGKREPLLYGSESFMPFFEDLQKVFSTAELRYVQTNVESEMVDQLQRAAANGVEGIVLNPAAYSHTSVAVADAVAAIDVPVIEVHISNMFAREEVRRHSLVSRYATGVITGFGLQGYHLALTQFLRS